MREIRTGITDIDEYLEAGYRAKQDLDDCLPGAALCGAREIGTHHVRTGVAHESEQSPNAVYAMAERAQLPGVTRIGRRVLVRSSELLHWLDQKSALSLKE